jgi:hypothetical protein
MRIVKSSMPLLCASPVNQFAKILVESEAQTTFRQSASEPVSIRTSGTGFAYSQNTMPTLAESADAIFRNVFVGAEPHGWTLSGNRKDFFFVQSLSP